MSCGPATAIPLQNVYIYILCFEFKGWCYYLLSKENVLTTAQKHRLWNTAV